MDDHETWKKDFDDAFEAYKTAADGLTYAEVDEAERRKRIARLRLDLYRASNSDFRDLDVARSRYFESVRGLLRFGRRWSHLTLCAFLGSLLGLLLGVIVTGRPPLGSIAVSVPFGLLHLVVRWRHERDLRRTF